EPGYQRSVSISLGQNIYTPEDISRTDLVKDDRPYAGIAYLAVGLHSRNEQVMNTFEIDAGIVGRHSYAEDFQMLIHQWIEEKEPRGWKHQLHDEPVVNLFFERKWKLFKKSRGGFGCDLIPHLGFGAGNMFVGADAGSEVRFGWNLPNDFGTFLIRPGSDSNAPIDSSDPRFLDFFHRFGIHLFFAVDGRAVLRNILLDGNTFRDSHSVDKEYFVADLVGGAGMILDRFKITYAYVYQTKEFKTQEDPQTYGSISVSATF
ncbi:MAG: lipid A deacylase LpxR family protein, partial [Deltaproteobacteria bacterium]|nr:lipid A deacylase LpxR family protein [Deltaproteobacteria bacterium]